MLSLTREFDWHIGRPTPIDPSPDTAHAVAFVAFAGQSNMVGFNVTRAALDALGWRNDPLTFIWNNQTGHFEVMDPTINTNAFSWGPVVGFAMDFRLHHPDTPLYLVQTAAGQTSLAQNLNANDDWSPASHGEMFDKMTARIDAAAAVLGKHPDAVFVDQGETDGTDPAAAAAYQPNFEGFLAAVRDRWMHDANGYVGWARVPDSSTFWHQVRDAQVAVDAETGHTDSFDTLDVPRQDDGIHYTADGLLVVGHRFEDLFEGHSGWL